MIERASVRCRLLCQLGKGPQTSEAWIRALRPTDTLPPPKLFSVGLTSVETVKVAASNSRNAVCSPMPSSGYPVPPLYPRMSCFKMLVSSRWRVPNPGDPSLFRSRRCEAGAWWMFLVLDEGGGMSVCMCMCASHSIRKHTYLKLSNQLVTRCPIKNAHGGNTK